MTGRPRYGILRACGRPGVFAAMERKVIVPHVNIKYFPVPITDAQRSALVAAVTSAVQAAFGCDERVISIALEPVDADAWNERVYVPEIVNRSDLLHKTPEY
jgi:phenylpyruvate tautomerase PptA (4-oxalocrotonate tautomerase family)